MPVVTNAISTISLTDAVGKVVELVRQESDVSIVVFFIRQSFIVFQEPALEKVKPSLKHTPKSDHRTSSERELDRIEAQLRNVQLSLEILTHVCAALPDPEPELESSAGIEGDAELDEEGGEALGLLPSNLRINSYYQTKEATKWSLMIVLNRMQHPRATPLLTLLH